MIDAPLSDARRLLEEPVERASPWTLLFAASMAALGAVLMAGVMVLGPGVSLDNTAAAASHATAQSPHG